jgi:excinuclease ABC subunit C
MDLSQKAAGLPEGPGVYLFKDAAETILYVGKARSLRSRVRSYFLESR